MNRLIWATLVLLLIACESRQSGLQLGEEKVGEKEAKHTADMIEDIKAISLDRYPSGTVKRFNQSKTLGCFDATLKVLDDLEAHLQQGIFRSGRSYPARLRFASATQEDDRDKDFHGLSIKLLEVDEPSLWGKPGQQDFVLNSYPALFVADPGDFRDFIRATRDDKVWRYFIRPSHFYSLSIAFKGREKIANPFAIRYWSTTPYRFGEDETSAVKYSVKPCAARPPGLDSRKHENFLSDAMRAHLKREQVCFDFMVQFQSDPNSMPIENAAVVWDETESPFVKLAQLHIENEATSSATIDNCEAMTFNPWQSLAAHRPLGGINRARRPIYAEIGQFRLRENRLRNTE